MVLLQPSYFSSIIQYVAIVNASKIYFEIEDNYQKQTYRNRCYIATAQGKHLLNVPVQHQKGIKKKTKDVKIDYKDNWQKQHLKTLQSAYSSSPFYEFYIDDLLPIFNKKPSYLLDLNFKCHELIMEALELDIPMVKTTEYQKITKKKDLRYLINNKNESSWNLEKYTQVFFDTQPFIPNLSILDLLFMEGSATLSYLQNQKIEF